MKLIGRLTANPGEAALLVDGAPGEMPAFAVDEVARELSRPDPHVSSRES